MLLNRLSLAAAGLRSGSRSAAIRALVLGALCMGGACGEQSVLPPEDAPNTDLQMSMSVSDVTPDVGQNITYVLTVRNNGPLPATTVLAADTIPTGLNYVSHETTAGSFSPTSEVWTIGPLDVNQTATLSIVVTVQPSAAGQTIINGAGVLSSDFNDSIPSNNIATAPVNVTAVVSPPPPVGVVFSSDWSTAQGTTMNALTDGGKWNTLYCQQAATTLTVVPGAPVGWTRTPNVLRLQQLGVSACGTLEKLDLVPVSTSHWGRLYFRNDEIGTQHNHVATYNPGVGAPIQVALWNRNGAANGVSIFLRTYYRSNGTLATYPTNVWFIGSPGSPNVARLPHGQWFRYEWHMEYVTPTSYRIWPRLYDLGGVLLFDATTIFQNDYPSSGPHSLASWYAAGNTFGFTDVSLGRRLGLGNEGPANSGNTGGYWYHADVAISTSGWIGQ